MNPSEQNNGAMFAAASMSSVASVRMLWSRKTPRKIPGLAESPKRGFIVTDRKLVGGNLCARDMLGHLRYWLEPDESGKPRSKKFHEGHFWEYCSITFWERQLGYSRQEVRSGIKALLASGAVVRESRQQGNNDYDHYRLVLDVCGIKERAICVASNTPPVASNTPTTEVTSEVTNTKPKNIKTAPQKSEQGKHTLDPSQTGQAEPPLTPDAEIKPAKCEPGELVKTEFRRLKAEWNAANEKQEVTTGISPTEASTLQRLEHALGEHAEGFFRWLTPKTWQRFTLADGIFDDARPNAFFLIKDQRWCVALKLYLADQPEQAQPLASKVATPTPPAGEGVANTGAAQPVAEAAPQVIIGATPIYYAPTDEEVCQALKKGGYKGSNPKPPPPTPVKLTAKG